MDSKRPIETRITFGEDMRQGYDMIKERAKLIEVKLTRRTAQLFVDGIMVKEWRENTGANIVRIGRN